MNSTAGPGSWTGTRLHFETLNPDALGQIVRRLARDWSVVDIETMPPKD